MISTFLMVLLYSATECKAQPTPKRSLLALSKTDHMLSIVDPVTLKTIARMPVGSDPHEVIASTDGKTAYVTIYGGGSLHELNILDLVAQKPLTNVDTRPLWGPHGIVFSNGKVWFSAEGSKAVGSYDPASGKIDWSMGTGQDRTHMIYVTADGKNIYTTNVSSGTVSILTNSTMQQGPNGPNNTPPPNAPSNGALNGPAGGPPGGPGGPPPGGPRQQWTQTVIPVSRGSEGFDVSPDGHELWTAASEDGTIAIIDLDAKKLSAKLEAKVNGANRVAFTPDGKQVFISSLQSGELTIYDTKSRTEVKRLKIGHGAAGILMDAEGSRAFVACSADNYIAIVDLKTLEVTSHFDVGGVPDGMAWAIRP